MTTVIVTRVEAPPEYYREGALISRETFLRWTGLKVWDFYALKRSRAIGEWRPPGAKRSKYYKIDAARICGWTLTRTNGH